MQFIITFWRFIYYEEKNKGNSQLWSFQKQTTNSAAVKTNAL